jgi:hypothetical protein
MWWVFEIIVQIGNDSRETIEDYCSTVDQYFTVFMARIRKNIDYTDFCI